MTRQKRELETFDLDCSVGNALVSSLGPENIRAKESLLGLHRPPSVGEFMVSLQPGSDTGFPKEEGVIPLS